jgi:hypothetical protein
VPVSNFRPVIDRLHPVLAQRIPATGTATVESVIANARLDRTLAINRIP